MGNAAVFSKNPLPKEYEETFAEKMIQAIASGKVPANGDKDKAMNAVYEIIAGEGAGFGREAEKFLLLGSDMTARVKGVQDSLARSLEVFGDITNGVQIDR